MRVLIIGGTRFVGRHLARTVLDRGHEVVLFNRGLTAPGLFPQATEVHGDRRNGGLEQLRDEEFDAVFDTTSYHPLDVEAVGALGDGIGRYCLVSSISVLREPLVRGADESAPVWSPAGPLPSEASTPEEYGLLKAQCEVRAREIFGDRALVVRPGIVVGPHDYSDRVTSWLRRLSYEDVVLAGEAEQPIQLIDARDLVVWMLDAAESGASGVFNVTGPVQPLSFADLLAAASDVAGSRARIVWVGDGGVRKRKLDLALWVPRADYAFFQVSNARARAAGLALRPLGETLADIKAWD